jgi:hypothetical protein
LLGSPGDLAGAAVDGDVDVDADGTADILVGAPADSFYAPVINIGHVRLYSGQSGAVLFEEIAAASHTSLGRSVAFVGDVNQDGFVDFAAGEPYDSTVAPSSGAVRVYSGRDGSALASILGDGAQTQFGIGVAAAGDLNLDGRPDLLVAGFTTLQGQYSYSRMLAISLAPGLQQYGTGTPGCSGIHHINANSVPAAGNANFAITTDNAPTHALGLGLIADVADVAGSDPFGLQLKLHLDFFASTELLSFDAFADLEGFATAPIAIPNNPLLQGLVRYAQTLWYWPGGVPCNPSLIGLSSSQGLTITVQ